MTDQHEELYFQSLEEWSDDIKEAGDHKACWYRKFVDRGLRVKLALDGSGTVGGMVQYLPIEQSFVEGKDLYLILCIWVHGHKQGRGNYQKRGMGKAMLHAAEADAQSLGAKGMAACDTSFPLLGDPITALSDASLSSVADQYARIYQNEAQESTSRFPAISAALR